MRLTSEHTAYISTSLKLVISDPTTNRAGSGSAGRVYGLGNHSRVDRKRPVILDSREPLFIRAFHDQQDSPPRRRMEGEPADPDALRAGFRLEGVALPSREQSQAFYTAYEEARRDARRKSRGSGRYLGQIAKRLQLGG